MAAAKNTAVKAGTGALAAGQAVRSNVYVQRLVDDDDLRENLRTAFESARNAYTRMANGRGPTQAVMDDKKTQRELKLAAYSLRDAAYTLRGVKEKRKAKRGRRLLLLGLLGGGAALAFSEGLRKKVLDALFGAEEEFEYTASTTPEAAPAGQPSG
jgi:hypothetical protein